MDSWGQGDGEPGKSTYEAETHQDLRQNIAFRESQWLKVETDPGSIIYSLFGLDVP